jgi:hypothetical protein
MVVAQRLTIGLHYGHGYLQASRFSPDMVNKAPGIRLVLLRNGQKHVQPAPLRHGEAAQKLPRKQSAPALHLRFRQGAATSYKCATDVCFQHIFST